MPDSSSPPLRRPDEPAEARRAPPRRSRNGGALHAPLWLRYVLALSVAAGVIVALVVAEHSSRTGPAYSEDRAAEAQANRESQIIVSQDQAPHSAPLPRRPVPRIGLERAIAADMSGRIRRHELNGPMQTTRCAATATRPAPREAFRCTVVAGEVNYPFLGVVDPRAGTVTWCKRDPPPVPSQDVPVSLRCRA